MNSPRIYAYFQNLDDINRLRLTCAGTLQDLERQGIELHEGLVLTLHTDDEDDQDQPDELRAEGIVTRCKGEAKRRSTRNLRAADATGRHRRRGGHLVK